MEQKKVYTLNYWLKNDVGDVVDTSDGGVPMVFMQGSKSVIPGIQKAVEGRVEGERLDVVIPPELAYGRHDPELVSIVCASLFDGVDHISPGMKFQTQTGKEAQVVQVTKVEGDQVTIDANHPLAGLTMNFELEIVSLRVATEAELQMGEAHEGA